MKDMELTEDIVIKAAEGNPEALQRVMEHFDGYINMLATGFFTDGAGKTIQFVDPELKECLRERLIKTTNDIREEIIK